MILFTEHAVDRYLDFHAIDRPTMTREEVRALLEEHAGAAIKLDEKTRAGDDLWQIQALGIELVARYGSLHGVAGNVCVTILPPPRLRGLSPLQAERVEGLMAEAHVRRDALARERAGHAAVRSVPIPAAEPARSRARAAHNHAVTRLAELRFELAINAAERDLLQTILQTMRGGLASDRVKAFEVCRLLIRFVQSQPDVHAAAVLQEVGKIEPYFLTKKFLNQ